MRRRREREKEREREDRRGKNGREERDRQTARDTNRDNTNSQRVKSLAPTRVREEDGGKVVSPESNMVTSGQLWHFVQRHTGSGYRHQFHLKRQIASCGE